MAVQNLSDIIRSAGEMTLRRKVALAWSLSLPAILAQLSAVIMSYIDAAMVGRLGAEPAASIGIVTTTIWLFSGLCSAGAVGFTVQVAHRLGAGRPDDARSILRQSIVATLLYSVMLSLIGVLLSPRLPLWLGGDSSIAADASAYFLIFSLALPWLQYEFLFGGMLRCAGRMAVAGAMGVVMCVLDVIFNFLLIFPTRTIDIFDRSVTLYGMGMGVEGAAIGTALATAVSALLLGAYLVWGRGELRLASERGSFRPRVATLRRALRLAWPMGLERLVTCSAQVTLTAIVAPLGVTALAANAFAITAEGLCYMPGFGIGDAATTLVGQSLGAGRRDLARSFAAVAISLGMIVMALTAMIMYMAAPLVIGMMSPDPDIVDCGSEALRIGLWAEPLFAAAIVAYCSFIGAGDTLVPCIFNLGCMWGVRITLAALLAPSFGLAGVWAAMAAELCVRGLLFLWRYRTGRWLRSLPAPRPATAS